jgi:RNA polymerase sigma-70 factor (ECF subfamily)
LRLVYRKGFSPEQEINAFKKLFNEYYNSIKNYSYYKSGNIELSEDITQDVFLKVWENRENLKGNSIQSYLYTIASNLLKNHYKKNRVSFNFVNSQLKHPASESPEYVLEMKEFNKKLQKVLASIPEKSRVVFLMNRMDGFTYEEIANKLNISVKAVEKRMHKALNLLKEHFSFKI